MVVTIKTYTTRLLMDNDKKVMNKQGFRTKHIDFVGSSFKVTYTNDPEPQITLINMTQTAFIKQLAQSYVFTSNR